MSNPRFLDKIKADIQWESLKVPLLDKAGCPAEESISKPSSGFKALNWFGQRKSAQEISFIDAIQLLKKGMLDFYKKIESGKEETIRPAISKLDSIVDQFAASLNKSLASNSYQTNDYLPSELNNLEAHYEVLMKFPQGMLPTVVTNEVVLLSNKIAELIASIRNNKKIPRDEASLELQKIVVSEFYDIGCKSGLRLGL